MKADTPDDSIFVSYIPFNIKITKIESKMNRQNKKTQNILKIILANQGIGLPISKRKSHRKTQLDLNKWMHHMAQDHPHCLGDPIPRPT